MEHDAAGEQQRHTTSEADASEADTLEDDEQQHGEAAAAGWRTSCMSLPQSSSPMLGGSADPPLQQQQQLEAGGVMRHSSTCLSSDKHGRVEALYSLKRSWVQQQQQLDSASADAAAAAAAADGHALRVMRAASMQQQQHSPQFVLKRPRYSQSLPGAGGAPSATSDGGGEGSAGIFDAPADYGGSAFLLRAVSGTRDTMHTCLHLCDSNRLVASKGTGGRPPEPPKQQQQQQPRPASTAAGGKRKSCDSGGGTLARQLSQPPSRIAPAAPDVCASGSPGGTASMPASFVQLAGMLANEQPGGGAAAAQHTEELASSHQQGGVVAGVHAGEDGSSKRADDHAAPVAAAVARLPVASLAPAPVNEAAAAAQMPPPAPQAPHHHQQQHHHHHHPDGPLPAAHPAAAGMGMMLGPGGVGLPTGFWMQQQQQLWGLAPGQQQQLLQQTLGLSAPAFQLPQSGPPGTAAAAAGGGTGMLQLPQAMPLSPLGLWPGGLLASAAWRPWATSALATVPASTAAGALQPPALLGAPFGSVGFNPAAAHTTALMAAALNGAAGGPLFGGPMLQQAAAAGTAGPPATHRRHGGGSEQTDSCRA
jgi:hypothetical protein